MAYIYMDESGDLTFGRNGEGSRYFVITFLIAKSEKDTEIIMKNFYKWTNGRGKIIKGAFFHSTKESNRSIKRILDLTSRREMDIVSAVLDKDNILFKYRLDTHSLYNKLTGELLQQCEKRGFLRGGTKHYFIASRKETNQFLKQNFIEQLDKSHSPLLNIDITIDIPQHRNGLEIVDACSHAIFRKYENGDFELYSVIKNKIILEKQIFD